VGTSGPASAPPIIISEEIPPNEWLLFMKRLLKNGFNRLLQSIANEWELNRGSTLGSDEVVAQKLLMQNYRLLAAQNPEVLPCLCEAGFRKYSQFEEDGILLYLFSLIRPVNRTCVEICAGNGRECMSANLIINHGWWGHLFDGNARNVADGIRFFRNCRDTFFQPPKFTHAWVTAENVNELLKKSGAIGPIDLLSLDIDGMDYWVWNAITAIDPQVVICETHNLIPPDTALTVPYDPKFVFETEEHRGASLAAMCKLGRRKGYRLVGAHRFGFNAFFLKDGVGEEFLPEIDPVLCQSDPYSIRLREELWPRVRQLRWQEV
jgi:hypothetical protein